ncbi:MAG: DsbA family protein [Shimia sp.]
MSLKTRIPLLVAIFLVAAGVTWYFQQPTSPAGPSLGAANAQAVENIEELGIAEMTLGEDTAPITIVEYASYTCPHCARFHEGAFQELKAEYIDSGQVQFVYREVYFDRFGLWASMIARCGGEERFFGITDLLYEQQSEWTQGGPAEIAQALRQLGISAGLTGDEVDACFSDAQKAENLVAWFETNRQRDDITSTPSFLIDGEKFSNMSMEQFREEIDSRL